MSDKSEKERFNPMSEIDDPDYFLKRQGLIRCPSCAGFGHKWNLREQKGERCFKCNGAGVLKQ